MWGLSPSINATISCPIVVIHKEILAIAYPLNNFQMGGGKGGGGGGGKSGGGGGAPGGGSSSSKGSGGGGSGMMKAPGGGGSSFISRAGFQSNPQIYFAGLHAGQKGKK
ncbi:unnamed protein product [Ilex paraguariensis]|uniref:Glycine-rich protein n=1 Tax=Ilex paraguariensis TaxID=185542 RepID=A0ABC8U743_9AQUA